MKELFAFINDIPPQVNISAPPDIKDLDKEHILENLCFKNAYYVATLLSGAKIIEGLIIANASGKAHRHAWNFYKGEHFDLSHEVIWSKNDEFKTRPLLKYLAIYSYDLSDFKEQDAFEFSTLTISLVDEINTVIQKSL